MSCRRRGVSILEVIFAILVTTIGLLAALTVFPVSAALARKGRIADETAIAGKAAFHAFDTYGMRRPDRLIFWDPTGAAGYFIGLPIQDGTSLPQSYCLDPRLIAHGQNLSGNAPATAAEYFPYSFSGADQWMHRVTLTSGVPHTAPVWSHMGFHQANSIFQLDDDFTVIRPSDGSLPAFGSFMQADSDNDGTPDLMTIRNSGGHLSWMATIVPKHEFYAPPNTVRSDQYVLSVVVFHDRPMVDFVLDVPTSEMYRTTERVVGVNFADAGGLGYAGGETLLIWPKDGTTVPANQANYDLAKEQMKVRAGDWIMLAGTASHISGAVIPVFKWYRVTEADHEPEYHTVEQHYEVAVSLAGQDWDTTLADQRAFLITGVVGVFEKTVRLETGVGF